MYLNFKTMKKAKIEVIARDTFSFSDKPKKNYKFIEVELYPELFTYDRITHKPLVNMDYFVDDWEGLWFVRFDRELYNQNKNPFVKFDCTKDHSWLASQRRGKIREAIRLNFTYDTQIKILRQSINNLYDEFGIKKPEALIQMNKTLEAIRKSHPKDEKC